MHELVFEQMRQEQSAPVLAQLPLDEGALIAAFSACGRRDALWVAKTGYGAAGVARLRAEAQALAQLAPLAESLSLPRLLGFREAGEGEQASGCLIQSAVAGRPMRCRWSDMASADVPAVMQAALDWLERFQQSCLKLPLVLPSLRDLGVAAAARAAELAVQEPELAPLLAWIPEVLVLPGQDRPAVAIHGDFWLGNVLAASQRFGSRKTRQLGDAPSASGRPWPGIEARTPSDQRERPRQKVASHFAISVVDWSSFGAGSALDDLLTWIGEMPAGSAIHPLPRVEAWPVLWLRDGRARHLLRAWAGRSGYDPLTARYTFYLFLARRLRWELGCEQQYRNVRERQWAQAQWSAVLEWLARRGYPDPFTARGDAPLAPWAKSARTGREIP